LKKVKDKQIEELMSKMKRYKLDLYVLDMTTDIQIPSFLAILVDKMGFPSVAVGSKSGLIMKEAIKSAILEAMMCRLFTRQMLKDGDISNDLSYGKTVFSDRARFWILPETRSNIDFMTIGKEKEYADNEKNITTQAELKKVISIISAAGYSVYCYETTIKEFKSLGFFAYQVIIPGLQPLYLREKERGISINTKRLAQVANFFDADYKEINPVPHPFL